VGNGVSSLEGQAVGTQSDNSPPCISGVKNLWRYDSTPPHVSTALRLVKCADNFVLLFDVGGLFRHAQAKSGEERYRKIIVLSVGHEEKCRFSRFGYIFSGQPIDT
jgi:hypothetical protein